MAPSTPAPQADSAHDGHVDTPDPDTPETDTPDLTTPHGEVTRPVWSLRWAAALTMLVGLAFLGVAIGTFAQLHGVFSIGVGVMLLLYALALLGIGFFAWRGATIMTGMIIAAAVLHIPAMIELAVKAPWVWATLPVFVATAALGVHARVTSSR